MTSGKLTAETTSYFYTHSHAQWLDPNSWDYPKSSNKGPFQYAVRAYPTFSGRSTEHQPGFGVSDPVKVKETCP